MIVVQRAPLDHLDHEPALQHSRRCRGLWAWMLAPCGLVLIRGPAVPNAQSRSPEWPVVALSRRPLAGPVYGFDRAKARSPDGRAIHRRYWDERTRRALRDSAQANLRHRQIPPARTQSDSSIVDGVRPLARESGPSEPCC